MANACADMGMSVNKAIGPNSANLVSLLDIVTPALEVEILLNGEDMFHTRPALSDMRCESRRSTDEYGE
jgi:hypothetical protein